MRYSTRTLLLLFSLLLFPGSGANAQVSIGVTIGAPPPPRVERVAAQPGPGYMWVDGYWYPVGSHWTWHAGYWTRAPYPGAYWVEPYHDGRRFVPGYWDGGHGRVEHDHHWDHRHDRDGERSAHERSR